MKCDYFVQQLDAYLDNELDGKERDAFERHGTVCGTCRLRLEDRQKLLELFTTARCENWSIDVTDTVMATLNKLPATAIVSPLRLPIIIAVASTLAVFLLLMVFGAGSVITGISPFEIIKSIGALVDLPPAVQDNLRELKTIFGAMFSAGKSLLLLIWTLFKTAVLSSPLIILPAFGLIAGVLFIFWVKFKSSRGRIMI